MKAIHLDRRPTAEAQVNAKFHDLPLLESGDCLRASTANINLGRSLMLLSIASKFVGGGEVGEVGLLDEEEPLLLLAEDLPVKLKVGDEIDPTEIYSQVGFSLG